jgi:RNA polymerase primary sigma factor
VAKLSDCWLPRVLKSAEGYVTPKLRMEDLVQEGNMALILALQQLCGKEKCDDVEGTLVAAVEEGIMNYASEMNGVKESEEAMLARVNLVHEARKLLTEEQGSVPSVEELSEYTKMPVQELKDIIDVLDNRNN